MIFRTSLFQLALRYAAVFAVLLFLVLGALYWAVSVAEKRDLKEDISEDLEDLVEMLATSDPATRLAMLEDIGFDEERDILLFEAEDQVWGATELERPPDGWAWVLPPWNAEDDPDEPFLARAVEIEDGVSLVLALDAEDYHDVREFFVEKLAFSFLAIFPVAILSGAALGAFALRRMNAIELTAAEIEAGRLKERIPQSGKNDEFDRLAGRLNNMLDRIDELTEGVRQVTNSVAHDMRAPIARLRRRLEEASLTDDPGRQKDKILAAIEEIDNLSELFSALLRIAELEAGAARAGFKSVDLVELCRDVEQSFEALVEDAGDHLHVRTPISCEMTGDPALLTQMLVNLIENALQHTPPGSTISLSLEINDDGSALLAVTDDGPGVPAADRKRIFDRFVMLEESRSKGGSGLGLSIVAAIAHLHRASVEALDMKPGFGVHIRFPPRRVGE